MSAKKPYQLTQEQLALAQKRKEQREAKRIAELQASEHHQPLQVQLVSRPWKVIENNQSRPEGLRAKIMTWNLLAQCLVRRSLFPTSDCLKASTREPMIHAEIRRQNADILCLQEVDRLEQLLPMLDALGYSHCYTSGPGKKHGCLVAFKKDLYSLQGQKTIAYDTSSVANAGTGTRIGNSFKTRNVGLIVSLKHKADNQGGVLVATTHLFWHPKYTYERIRQAAILFRETLAFRQTENAQTWPVIIAGDFNFSPDDPGYALLFKECLLPHHKQMIAPSYVVHSSVDPTVSTSLSPGKISSDDESEATDPDRVITNARPARPEDGQLSIQELVDLYATFPKPRSAYHDGITFLRANGDLVKSYGSRKPFAGGQGTNEPDYTSFTHYWKSVLDYIFILDPEDKSIKVSGILSPMLTSDMEPGLPRLGVSGSDHTSLVTELSW